jgi:hypothetical protein
MTTTTNEPLTTTTTTTTTMMHDAEGHGGSDGHDRASLSIGFRACHRHREPTERKKDVGRWGEG